MVARPLVAACVLAALTSAGSGTGAAGVDGAHPTFSRAQWVDLVGRYARGERAQSTADLGAWNERDLVRQVEWVEQAARAAERCPSCPNPLQDIPMRAAVMLHWDRDHAEQPSPMPGEVEQPRRCPGPAAVLAGRLARVLAGKAETSGFARHFFRMVVLQCQWDACFTAAERWASDAVRVFPKDTDLLLARGSIREEVATVGWPGPAPAASPSGAVAAAAADARARREKLETARQDFADAIAIDPGLGLARVRLGRVLWRLGEAGPARQQLEAALASASLDGDHVYLARLFLGRLDQDAGRLADATREYERAAEVHPSALSAGTALSNVLLLAGDAEGARRALRQGLARAGHRSERDPLWDDPVMDTADLEALRDALYRESLQ